MFLVFFVDTQFSLGSANLFSKAGENGADTQTDSQPGQPHKPESHYFHSRAVFLRELKTYLRSLNRKVSSSECFRSVVICCDSTSFSTRTDKTAEHKEPFLKNIIKK